MRKTAFVLTGWAAAVGALEFILTQSTVSAWTFYSYLACMVGLNVILAVSLNIINGMAGQFSIGHAGFMAVGAYVAGVSSQWLSAFAISGAPGWMSDQLLMLVALLSGGLAAATCGVAVGLPSLRLRGDYLAIVTLGFGEIIRVIIQNTDSLGGALGLSGIPQHAGFGAVWFWVGVTVVVAKRLSQSAHGRALFAIREDEIAAGAMGVDTTSYKVYAFVLSSFFAGVAGGLFAHVLGVISPSSFTFVKSMEIVVMVVAGGLGSTTGAIAAAVFLTLLPEVMRSVFTILGSGDPSLAQRVDQARMPVYGLLLVALMLLRPQGVFGGREWWDRRAIRRRGKVPA